MHYVAETMQAEQQVQVVICFHKTTSIVAKEYIDPTKHLRKGKAELQFPAGKELLCNQIIRFAETLKVEHRATTP